MSSRDFGNFLAQDARVLPPSGAPTADATRHGLPGGDESAPAEIPLFGGGGPGTDGSAVPGFVAAIAPSGKSIVLTCRDASGAPTNITALRKSNEVQTLSLSAVPSGGAFVLSFDGQATGPIAAAAIPPMFRGRFTLTGLTPGASLSFALNYYNNYGTAASDSVLFRFFDGNTEALPALLGSTTIDQQHNASDFNDAGFPWKGLGTFTPTGKSLVVQVTSSLRSGPFLAALRVQDPSNVVTYHGVGDSSVFSTTGGGLVSPGFPYVYGGSMYGAVSSGTDYMFTVTGGAAAIQAALQALPTVRAGNVSVSTLGDGVSAPYAFSYPITFINALENEAQSAIACPDAAVSIARTSPGGVGNPVLSIPGRPPVILNRWLWYATTKDAPTALSPLSQAAQAVRTVRLYSDVFLQSGSWGGGPDGPTLSGSYIASNNPALTASYPFQALPVGDYRFAITYPVKADNSPNTQCVIKDGSGNVVASVTIDQTAAPSDYSALGFGWKYVGGTFSTDKFNSGFTLTIVPSGSGVCYVDAVQFLRTSADDSIVPLPGSTIAVPDGWLTTAAGPAPAAAGLPVLPPAPTAIIPAFNPSPKVAGMGINISPESYYAPFPIYSNLARRLNSGIGLASNANGYPTRISGPTLVQPIVSSLGSPGGNREGYKIIRPGRYTLTWSGASDLSLNIDGGTSTLASSTAHRKVYNVSPTPGINYCVGISLAIQGTGPDPADPSGKAYIADVADIAIYPPDPADPTGQTDWVAPPLYHPSVLYKAQGARCIRYLDWSSVNGNAWSDFSHFKPASHVSRANVQNQASINVVEIKAPAARFFSFGNGPSFPMEVQITTDGPHPFFEGQSVTLIGSGTADALAGGTGQATFDTQPPRNLDGYACCDRVIHVVDSTNIVLQVTNGTRLQNGTTAPSRMLNTLKGGTLSAGIGTTAPLQDFISFATAAGATEIWFNVAVTATRNAGGCVDQVAAFFAANMPAGMKIHVEFGNECWNSSFPATNWCIATTNQITGVNDNNYVPGYVQGAKQVHDRFQAVFAAAGRPNDVIHTFAIHENAAAICAEAARIGARVDEIADAGYFGNGHFFQDTEPTQLAIYPTMTPDQCLDFLEFNVEHGGWDTRIAAQLASTAAAGFPSAKYAFYEAALETPVPGASYAAPPQTPNFYSRTNAVRYHPRTFGVMLRMFQKCQDAGMGLWNHYILGLIGGGIGPTWGLYEGIDQQHGTGNPALDPVNVSDPFSLDQVKSEVGGALYSWSTLAKSTAITKTTAAARNGKLRASNGLPRGLLRTVR